MAARILLTGTISNACIPDYYLTRSQIGLIPVNQGIKDYLANQREDVEVDWRPVEWGENLDHYDIVINSLMSPSNMTAGEHYAGSLWALRHPNCRVFIEDWQAAGVYNYGLKRKPGDSLRRAGLPRFEAQFKKIPADEMSIFEQAEADWILPEHHVAIPLFDGGNPAAVLPDHPSCYLHNFNPNQFMTLRSPRTVVPPHQKERAWCTAALSKGNRERFHKSVGEVKYPLYKLGKNVKGDHYSLRLHETEAIILFSSVWFNYSVGYPHTKKGSGWWRMRYQQVTDGGSIVVCESKAEAELLGDHFVFAQQYGSKLEDLSDEELAALASYQRLEFFKHRTTPTDGRCPQLEDWIFGNENRRDRS